MLETQLFFRLGIALLLIQPIIATLFFFLNAHPADLAHPLKVLVIAINTKYLESIQRTSPIGSILRSLMQNVEINAYAECRIRYFFAFEPIDEQTSLTA
jgi:hypothetical protein